jgi:Ca2+-binding RTX toxin-like protein
MNPSDHRLQLLEARRLFSASISGRSFLVTGTEGDDVIEVRYVPFSSPVSWRANRRLRAGGMFYATVNGVESQGFSDLSVFSVEVRGLGGNDQLRFSLGGRNRKAFEQLHNSRFQIELNGGEGADQLRADNQSCTLAGYEGDDTMVGSIHGDRFDGGEGSDTIDYSARTSPVYVDLMGYRVGDVFETVSRTGGYTLDGRRFNADTGLPTGPTAGFSALLPADAANFAGAGRLEGDSLAFETVENILGSSASDVLLGSTVSNYIAGNAGDDYIVGGLDRDFLSGNAGNDTLMAIESVGDDFPTRIDPANVDRFGFVRTGRGDRLRGGPGRDVLRMDQQDQPQTGEDMVQAIVPSASS